jgi:hypothetical protein
VNDLAAPTPTTAYETVASPAEHLVPVAVLRQLEDEIERISRQYARVGAPSVRLLDTGRRDGELAVVRLVGGCAHLGDWDIVCVLHHRDARVELEPLAPLSVEQRARSPRHGRCARRAGRSARARRRSCCVSARPGE